MKIDKNLQKKYLNLQSILRDMQKVVLAYSGGVDSTLLLKVGTDILGQDCIAILAISASLSKSEYNDAVNIADLIGANLVTITTTEMENEKYFKNDLKRCFYCKYELFSTLRQYAINHGISFILDGSNIDDTSDYRPGLEAADKLQIRSPLIEENLNKKDIRCLSKYFNLPTWDKPAQACLASRVAYGHRISPEILHKIDQAEQILKLRGFKIVRVRYHGNQVSVEVGAEEIDKLQNRHERSYIVKRFKKIGFENVMFDEEGYKSGKLNRILATK